MSSSLKFRFLSSGVTPQHIRKAIAEAVERMEGKELQLSLSVAKKYSSDPQRQYYFAVIIESYMNLFKHYTGDVWDKEETHDWLMRRVGRFEIKRKDIEGAVNLKRRSYMDLSTAEVEEYHTKCRQFAAGFGCDISEPNEAPINNYLLAG